MMKLLIINDVYFICTVDYSINKQVFFSQKKSELYI